MLKPISEYNRTNLMHQNLKMNQRVFYRVCKKKPKNSVKGSHHSLSFIESNYSQMLKIGTLFCAKNWDVGRRIADTFFGWIVRNSKTRKIS